MAGEAKLGQMSAQVLSDQLHQALGIGYNEKQVKLTVNVDAVVKSISDAIAAIDKYFKEIKAKKDETAKLLAAGGDASVIASVISNCSEIESKTKAAQNQLETLICLNKSGKFKGNLQNFEAQRDSNIVFMNRFGPAVVECANSGTFTPWQKHELAPPNCKGPCFDAETYVFNCPKLKTVLGVDDETDDEKILAKYINANDFEDDNPCLSEAEYYSGLKDGFKASLSDLWELTKTLGESQTYKNLYYALKVLTCGFPCPDAKILLSQISLIDGISKKLAENIGVLPCYDEGLATGKIFADMLAGEGILATTKKGIRLLGKAVNKIKIAKPIEGAGGTIAVKELGAWTKINRGMSVFSREYQGQISGKVAQLINGKWQFTEYKIGDVLFDGFDKVRNVLLDAKGNYSSLLKANIAQSGLRDEAIRQLGAAKNIPIEWHFAIKEDADIVRQYFLQDPEIGNKIKLIFTTKK